MKSPTPATTSSDSLFLGAAWYPEQWSKAVQEEDIRLMRSLDMNVVRVAEFAWSSLEPKEGIYELGWLRDAIELAHANGIRVVIGTPTPTPPSWMLKKYPEIGYVEPDGYRHRHGARQHACYNNPTYRAYGRKITEVLAREFGKHPAVVAWQTDNELRGHQKICVCPACQASWALWLKDRYGSIDKLNQEWGTNVWSTHYDSFEDVPTLYRLCCWSHSFSLVTNYKRFMSDTAITFQSEHVRIIHEHSPYPVSHNSEDSIDEWDLFQTLDFAAADIYVGYISQVRARMRIDTLRMLKPGKRFWTMETGCDSLSAERMRVGEVACIGFLNYVSGSQAVLYWCWRQHRTGTEIQHVSLVYSNGQPTTGWEEVVRVGAMRSKLETILRDYSPEPAETAIILSESNAHYFFGAGLEADFSYRNRMADQYGTLLELGAWRDVLSDKAPLDGYKIIFTPYLPYVSTEFLERIQAHLNRGGAWVVGPYTGYRGRDHAVPTDSILGEVEKLLGFKTKFFCPANNLDIAFEGGFQGKGQMFTTVFETTPGDDVLGTYTGEGFKNLAWGVSRAFGKGRVYVLGSEIDSKARAQLYAKILDREKINRVPLPLSITFCPQVTKDGRKGWALSNLGATAQDVTLPGPGRDLLTGNAVKDKITILSSGHAFIAFD
ncbi:beta-galactosidase [Methylacidiphilales bacterium]|nr:beta-galactosidase [Candidatus Methylacidiphilales bacterium]